MTKLIKEALVKALTNAPKKRESYPFVVMAVLVIMSGFLAFHTTATTEEQIISEELIEQVPIGAQTLEEEYQSFLTANPGIEQTKPAGDGQLFTMTTEEECPEGQHMSYAWVDGYYSGPWWNFIWNEGYWESNGCVADMEQTETPQCGILEAYEGSWTPAEYDYTCTDWGFRRFGHLDWRWTCMQGEEVISGGYWEGQCVQVYECWDGNDVNGDGCNVNHELEDSYFCKEVTGQTGWFGRYFNYSREHSDMNLPGYEWPDDQHGDPLGAWDADWYSNDYFKFNRVDSNLEFGADFFPFDMAPEEIDNNHEYHFGAHWRAQVTGLANPADWAATPTNHFDAYDFTLTSDDDSWIYVDGVLVYDNSGIHAPATINGSLNLYGEHIIDIFFAERHIVGSHMYFAFEYPENVKIVPMPEDCQTVTGSICGLKFNDTDHNGKYNGEDYPMSKWQVNLFDAVPSYADDVWADEVSSHTLGEYYFHFTDEVSEESQEITRNAFMTNYGNPDRTLGPATGMDPFNYYAMGGGGELILEFDNIIMNGSGDDLELFHLSAYSEINPEFIVCADVYASQDQTNWEYLGNNCDADDNTFDLGSLPWAHYAKLVDTTDLKTIAQTLPDNINFFIGGFSVDAVSAMNSYSFSNEPIATAWTDESGYCFNDLEPGYYEVCEVMQEGWENSTPLCQKVWLESGETINVDFGNHLPLPTATYEVSKTLLTEGEVNPGDVLEFNLSVTNTGSVDITNIDIRDLFTSSILEFSNASVQPDVMNTSSLAWLGGIDEDGVLDAGQTWTINVSFLVREDATIDSYGHNVILTNHAYDEYGHSLPGGFQSVWFQVVANEEEPEVPTGGGGGGGGGFLGPITFLNQPPIPQVLGEQEVADCAEIGDYPAGSLIAQSGVRDATVYYISNDCERYFFPDAKTYFTWYEDWSGVSKVNLDDLTAYANSGVAITYRPGTKLVKTPENPNVYAIEPKGVLRLIPSMEVGNNLFGSNWLNNIQDIIPSYFNSYSVSDQALSSTLPTGTLVKDSTGGDQVYYIENSAKRMFTGDGFNQNKFKSKYITTADLNGYALGANIDTYDYNLADPLEGRDR